MAKAKNNYIGFELDWLQAKAEQLKKYVDANPFDTLTDRKIWKHGSRGESEEIAATIEAQRKDLGQALKDYGEVISVINNLREKEEQKQISVRGDQTLSPFESGDIH